MKKLLMASIFLFLIIAGCSSDDPVSGDNNDSFITGKWKMEFDIWTASVEDSVGVKLDIKGNNGIFSGTGEINYLKKRNSTTTRYKYTDNTTGTYSQTELKVTCKSSISNNTFTFTGNRDGSSANFKGKVTLLMDGTSIEFTDVSIFKY